MKQTFLCGLFWATLLGGIPLNSLGQVMPGPDFFGFENNPAAPTLYLNGAEVSPFTFSSEFLNSNYSLSPVDISSVFGAINLSELREKKYDGELSRAFPNFEIKKNIQPNGYGQINVKASGPSFRYSKGKYVYGYHSSLRILNNMDHIPAKMATYIFNGARVNDAVREQPYQAKGMNITGSQFFEIGFSVSRKTRESAYFIRRMGTHIKALIGLGGYYFHDQNSTYNITTNNEFEFINGHFHYGLGLKPKGIRPAGLGLATDIGWMILRKEKTSATRIEKKCPNLGGYYPSYHTYKWKLGISLLDFGFVNYGANTITRDFTQVNYKWQHVDSLSLYGPMGIDNQFVKRLSPEIGAGMQAGKKFTLLLPYKIAIQLSYKMGMLWYLDAYFSSQLNHGKSGNLGHLNTLLVQPNIKTRHFGIGIPLGLIQLKKPSVGINFRLGPLQAGTYTLPEFLGKKSIYQFHFFIGLMQHF